MWQWLHGFLSLPSLRTSIQPLRPMGGIAHITSSFLLLLSTVSACKGEEVWLYIYQREEHWSIFWYVVIMNKATMFMDRTLCECKLLFLQEWTFLDMLSVSVSVQSLSHVRLFATPWITALQASLFITNSQSSLKLMSIESVMPSNHLILCRPLLLLPSIFPSIRGFSNDSVLQIRWPKYWSFSFSISPSNE